MAKKIKTTYYDNYDYDFDAYKESYQECNELTDEEMEDVSDNTIFDYIWECLDMEWDDFFSNLAYSKFANTPCVITGSLGLWTGRHGIVPVKCDNLESAIRKCVNNMDYICIKQNCGHLEVTGIHHDGSNTFEIHLLNSKGIDAADRIDYGIGNANLECRCYHKAISGYLF